MARLIRALGVLGTVALAVAGCGSLTESLVHAVGDTAVTTEIKTEIAKTEGMGTLTNIGVNTDEDRVRLTGMVADDAQRQRVETIARRLAGDNRVISELTVEGSAAASARTTKPR
jgi:hyperosmotically inducible periplasmic protein